MMPKSLQISNAPAEPKMKSATAAVEREIPVPIHKCYMEALAGIIGEVAGCTLDMLRGIGLDNLARGAS